MRKIIIDRIGSDIEWQVIDKETKEFVSAEGLVKGTKDNPYKFDKKNDFFATSLDNVLYEGNIPPARTPYQFYKNVQKLSNYIRSTLPENLDIACLPSARYDEKYLQTENARVYGCSISYNGWTGEPVHPKPDGSNLRAAGGHIHISYDDPNYEDNTNIIKAMDLWLGIPSVLMEPENERRRTGYGKAGNFRHTNFGVEYRSLSSHFFSTEELTKWCFNNTKKAVNFLNKGGLELIQERGIEIQNTINFEDKEQAQRIVNEFKIVLPCMKQTMIA